MLACAGVRMITVRLEDSLLEAVDGARGLVPREAWIRELLSGAVKDNALRPARERLPVSPPERIQPLGGSVRGSSVAKARVEPRPKGKGVQ